MESKTETRRIKITCEMEITLHVIGGKYKPLIIYFLIREGEKRFGEILRYLETISQKTLTNQLRELEADGIVKREVFPEVPPRVEYQITEKGRSLYPVLEAMCEWGWSHPDDKYEMSSPQCGEKPEKAERP